MSGAIGLEGGAHPGSMKVIADGSGRNVLAGGLRIGMGTGGEHDTMKAEQAFWVSGEPGLKTSELSPLSIG